jgi:hypothetical protein
MSLKAAPKTKSNKFQPVKAGRPADRDAESEDDMQTEYFSVSASTKKPKPRNVNAAAPQMKEMDSE